MMTRIVLDKEQQIKKPCQLGAFVLSYSREIMLNYMKIIDPTLKTHVFSYTDTDSLHIMGEHYKKFKELGMIKDSLGYLDNDIKKDGIIIYENNLGPKNYIYEYINNKNEVSKIIKSIPDFSMELKLNFDSNIFSLFSAITPSDFYKISKCGVNVRIDMNISAMNSSFKSIYTYT